MTANILLVEDDPDQASLFTMVLTLAGYDTVTTADATTGLARMADTTINLVLVDWDLPGMKGDAFITLVQERYPGVKTVLFSNHGNVDEAGRACHADAWMVKSDGIKCLQQLIAALLPPA